MGKVNGKLGSAQNKEGFYSCLGKPLANTNTNGGIPFEHDLC